MSEEEEERDIFSIKNSPKLSLSSVILKCHKFQHI